MKVQNKKRFTLVSICSKLTSAMIINILKGLYCWEMQYSRWVECRRKICLFERVPRRSIIQFSSYHVRLLLDCFSMPRPFGVALLSIKCDRILCFRKSAAVLIFAPLILRVALCQVYTVWIAFAGFITFASIFFTFECIITFVVNYYICSFNICDKREWALVSDQTWSKIWGLPQCKNQGTFSLFCTFCFPRFFCADFFVSFILRHTWVLQVVTGWAKICRIVNSCLANPLSAYKQLKDRSPLSAFTTAAPKNVTEHET